MSNSSTHDHELELELQQCLQQFERICPEDGQRLQQCLQGWVHEFRSPLSAVFGYCLLVIEKTSLTAEQQAYIETIQQASRVLLNAVNAFANSIPQE